jgi:hypothetical protein
LAGFDNRDCIVEIAAVQYRKWVTNTRWRRLSKLNRQASAAIDSDKILIFLGIFAAEPLRSLPCREGSERALYRRSDRIFYRDFTARANSKKKVHKLLGIFPNLCVDNRSKWGQNAKMNR